MKRRKKNWIATCLWSLATVTWACGGNVLMGAAPEPLATYSAFLTDHPAISTAIGLTGEEEKQTLNQLIGLLETTGKLPPPAATAPAGTTESRLLHLRRAAFCLWVELHRKVPWTLGAYSKEDLNLLLSYDQTQLTPPSSFGKFLGGIDQAFHEGKWVKQNRQETIFEIGQWIKTNITHHSGAEPVAKNVDEFLKGGHWGSCHETGDFFAVVATSMNIPCRTARYPSAVVNLHGHRYLDFPADKLFVVHGDDFYNREMSDVPVERIFADASERKEILDLLNRAPAQLSNYANRRKVLLYLEFDHSPRLLAAAREGADAVYHLVDEGNAAVLRGERIHYLDPIRQEIMDEIKEKLPSIRSRKP